MISCHEGTSSQTIFSAETQLLPVLGQREPHDDERLESLLFRPLMTCNQHGLLRLHMLVHLHEIAPLPHEAVAMLSKRERGNNQSAWELITTKINFFARIH